MQRFIARILLLLALAGNTVPLALAATTAPVHACCRRTAAHHCHDSAADVSNQLHVHSAECCNHDCCKAVTTQQWANPQPRMTVVSIQLLAPRALDCHSSAATKEFSAAQSTRAPPQIS